MDDTLFIDYKNGAFGSIDRKDLFDKFKHTFFYFNDTADNIRLNYIATLITSYFLKNQYPNISRLKSDLTLKQVHWTEIKNNFKDNKSTQEKIAQVSRPINFRIIQRHLIKNKTYKHEELNLPELISFWMDRSINAVMNFYYKGDKGEIAHKDDLLKQQYGKTFPLTPQLNQEGFLITSFLELLTKRIIRNRKYLVLNSHDFYTSDWLFTLKDILNDIISLVDISLNQLYLKASFDKKSNWKFNVDEVGERFGRRLSDKLNWVKKITGNDLKAEKERLSLMKLKDIRNHLNHFDPPSFVATLNEICDWLNDVFDIVNIVIKIRQCAGEALNKDLIELYLQPDIKFKPYAPRDSDVNNRDFGYNSIKYFK